MLHPTANTRLYLVKLFLLVRQRFIPIALLANHRNITTLSQARINPLSHIRRIRNAIATIESEKVLEGNAVADLQFGLVIGEVIH